MTETYTDLTLRLRAKAGGGFYPIEAELDNGQRFDNGRLTLDQATLSANELNPAEYGRLLFEALFTPGFRTAYDTAAARADALTAGRLRVRLWIDPEAAELHALPWERLYRPAPGGQMTPLTTHIETPFSRYTSLDTPEPPPLTERPLRLLAVLANPDKLPAGLVPADAEAEIASLRQALSGVPAGLFQITLIPGRSPLSDTLRSQLTAAGWKLVDGNTTLDNILAQVSGQHLLHYIGHGSFTRSAASGAGTARLFLEKADGSPQPVKDDDLIARLSGNLPRLIFLGACESAKRDPAAEDAFVGLGPKLVRAGAPAVVAMQAEVPVATARKLSAEFYRRLAEHGEVDKALTQARLLTFDPNRTDWAIPVLFSRLKTGALFTVGDAAKPEPAAPITTNIKNEGGLTFNVGGSVTIGGDVVGRDKIVTGGEGPANPWAVLEKQLAKAAKAVDTLTLDDPDDKDQIKDLIDKVEANVKENDLANLERRLTKIGKLSPEALAAVVKALTNVAVNAPAPVQAVAKKFA